MPFTKTADGTNLFYKDGGDGRPVVFIHGWPLTADMWDYQMVPVVQNGLRATAYDRRGSGRSDQPGGVHDYDVLAQDLHTLPEFAGPRRRDAGRLLHGRRRGRALLSRHGSRRIGRCVLPAAVTPFLLKTADNADGVDGKVFEGMIEQIQSDRPHFLAGLGKTLYGVGLLTSPVSSELLRWTGAMAP